MKRHDTDLVSMIFALVFLLLASLWPLWRLAVLDWDSLTWVPATALILVGLLGLALSIARSRGPRGAGMAYPVDAYDPASRDWALSGERPGGERPDSTHPDLADHTNPTGSRVDAVGDPLEPGRPNA